MVKIYPNYYKDFKCISSECEDNCCIGWEIDIDEKTARKYMNIENEHMKLKLKNNIKFDNETFSFKLNGQRCAFLNDNNLCEIIISLGEEYLCEICNNHPRFYNEYCNVLEIGVGLSCPKANSLILSENYNGNLVYEGSLCNELPSMEKVIFNFRDDCFTLLDNTKFTLFEKINIIIDNAYNLQDCIDENEILKFNFTKKISIDHDNKNYSEIIYNLKEIINIYLSLEILDYEWKRLLNKSLNSIDNILHSKLMFKEYKIKNMIKYFLYRYLIKTNEDNDLISKIQLCIVSVIMIIILSQINNDFDKVARLYSKEIEYCETNIFILQQKFIICDIFLYSEFKKLTYFF